MRLEFLWGRPGEDTPVDVHEARIPLPDLPRDLAGLRLAVIADLHVGRFVQQRFAERIVRLVNDCRPDIILLPGDMVHGSAGHMDTCVSALSQLRAPLGVFGSLGNHEHYAGPRRCTKAYRDAGVDMLVNRHRILHRNGCPLVLAGVDDHGYGRPDIARALLGAPGDAITVLMSHNPDFATHLPDTLRVDLVVAGHTHGGQVRLGAHPLFKRCTHPELNEGRAKTGAITVYTSRGIGMVGLPLRLNCRPEIPVLNLVRE